MNQRTLEELSKIHNDLIEQCIKTNYYADILHKVIKENSILLENETEENVAMFWHLFWEELPDSWGIRHSPLFYRVCDLAEGIFNE